MSTSASGFEDGFGRRVLAFDRERGDMLERLYLRPEFIPFERTLRDTFKRIGATADKRIVAPQHLERDSDTGTLVAISRFVEGERLSEVLEPASGRRLNEDALPGIEVALGFLLEVLPTLEALRRTTGMAHGALGPTRCILISTGRVVLTECGFAPVLQKLGYNPQRLWTAFRIASPPSAKGATFGVVDDIAQIALASLMLVVGRTLKDDEASSALPKLLAEVVEIAQIRCDMTFAINLQRFMRRVLPLPGRHPYPAIDATVRDLQLLAAAIGTDLCKSRWTEFTHRVVSSQPATGADASSVEDAGRPYVDADERGSSGATKGSEVAPAPARHDTSVPAKVIQPSSAPEPSRFRRKRGNDGAWRVSVAPAAVAAAPAAALAQRHDVEPDTAPAPAASAPLQPILTVVQPQAVPDVQEAPAVQPHVSPAPPAPPAVAAPDRVAAPTQPSVLVKVQPAHKTAPVLKQSHGAAIVQPQAPPAAPPKPASAAARGASADVHPPAAISTPAPVLSQTAPPAITDEAQPEAPAVGQTPPALTAPMVLQPILTAPQPPVLVAVTPAPAAAQQPLAAASPPSVHPAAPQSTGGMVVRTAAASIQPVPHAAPTSERSVQPDATVPASGNRAPAPPAAVPSPVAQGRTYVGVQPIFGDLRTPTRLEVAAPALVPEPVAAPVTQQAAARASTPPVRLKTERPSIALRPSPRYEPQNFSAAPAAPLPEVTRSSNSRKTAVAALILVVVIGAAGRALVSKREAPRPVLRAEPTAQLVTPSAAPVTGTIVVHTQPAGARVLLDGEPAGESPLRLDNVTPGRHVLTFIRANANVKRTVHVEPGNPLTLDVPLFSGWVAIFAPIILEISEDERALGTTQQGRIMLPPGRHTLTLTNREFGYSASRVVEVEAGEVRAINVEPTGFVNVNATPWAEIWVDGRKAGETPLAKLELPLGNREVVFKNPNHAERREMVMVTARESASVFVDFTK